MLTIYGVYRSRATRPLWLLHETGTEFQHVPVKQAYRVKEGEVAGTTTASPGFLAVNPLGQIPVMEDDGLILTESLAITLYLARRYGGSLGPANDAEAGLMEQWALFAATAVEGPAIEILYAGADATGEAVTSVACEKLRRPFSHLEKHLTGRAWLLGDRFTAADIVVEECARYAQKATALMAEFPELSRWIAAAQARPGFQAMWERRLAEPE